MAGIGRALEGSAPVSRLHQLQSFDPAGFPVPTGREEDWRLTPLTDTARCSPSGPVPQSEHVHAGLSAQEWPHTARRASSMMSARVRGSTAPCAWSTVSCMVSSSRFGGGNGI
jgi:hypothetical protein